MKLKERAKKLKTDIPAVFIALKQKETPLLGRCYVERLERKVAKQ